MLAYQTAYLKAHYPAEFMAAVLSSDMDNTDKVVGFYQECGAMLLEVAPPNINLNDYPFSVSQGQHSNESDRGTHANKRAGAGTIQYGLGAIKGVGEAAAKHIVEERKANGPYCDLFDFCARVDLHKVSRRTIEPLIYSGAMDMFGVNRTTLLASVDKAIKAADQKQKSAAQVDLFATMEETAPDYEVIEREDSLQKLEHEKAVLGHYLSGHPIKIYENELSFFTTTNLFHLSEHLGQSVTVAGLLIDIRRIITKTGRRMAILKLEDRFGTVEVTLFSKIFETVAPYLEKNQIYIVNGKVEEDSFNQSVRMLGESVDHLDIKRAQLAKRLVIFAESLSQAENLIVNLSPVIEPFQGGDCPIQVVYKTKDAKAKLDFGKEWKVSPKSALLAQLKQLCGEAFVKVGY